MKFPIKAETFLSKTFWAGLASIATGVGLIVSTGDWQQGAPYVIGGVLAVCGRDAIAKLPKTD